MIDRSARTVAIAALVLGTALTATIPGQAASLWIDDSTGTIGKVDLTTGAVTLIGSAGVALTDIAFSPTGQLYGIDFNRLYSINSTTGAASLIGSTGQSLNSLVFSAAGTLYSANTFLYTLNTSTGAATAIGRGGEAYSSSGDLAFSGGNLYLSSLGLGNDELVRLNTTTGVGTFVGSLGLSAAYGLASSDGTNLYAVSGTRIFSVNVATGASTLLLDYGGHGLGFANGTAFFGEAGGTAPVPEPGPLALMLAGLLSVGAVMRARTRR